MGTPLLWVRLRPNGSITDEYVPDWRMEEVRKKSGAWMPLFAPVPLPRSEYHEDMGSVTWWCFPDGPHCQPLGEPAWIGSPSQEDWPDYHTHFTPHPTPWVMPVPAPTTEPPTIPPDCSSGGPHPWTWLYKGADPTKLVCAKCEATTEALTPEGLARYRLDANRRLREDVDTVQKVITAYELGLERPRRPNPYRTGSMEFLSYNLGGSRGIPTSRSNVRQLAESLAEAVDADEKGDGCDLSAGMFGPNLSSWLRRVAAGFGQVPPGWAVEFSKSPGPIPSAAIRAPNGYYMTGTPVSLNPGNVIYMLAEAMSASRPEPSTKQGDSHAGPEVGIGRQDQRQDGGAGETPAARVPDDPGGAS